MSTQNTLPAAPRQLTGVWLVAEREIGSKLRSKAFVISTIVLFVAALASIVLGGFAAQNAGGTKVAVTAQTASVVSELPGLEVRDVANRAEAEALVESGDVDVAVVEEPSAAPPFDYVVVANETAPSGFVMMLANSPEVELLNPETATNNAAVRYFVALGFGFIFLLAASMFGGTIAQSVVEEKQTRVVELLISAIPARSLLAGKVIGNTVLAMGQILGLAAIAVVGLIVIDQVEVLQGLGSALVWFAVFFLFGFILLAALFAAAGAMVSRQEDIGATTTPITMLVMAPYFLVIFFNDNPVVLGIMSYVPFSAPVGMPVRLFLGEAQWWEPVVALVILLATCVAAIAIGARIYENSLLRMGGRVKLREALKG